MEYFKKIEGVKIYLSPLNPNDYDVNVKWLNNIEVASKLEAYTKSFDLTSEKIALEEMSKSPYHFAIVTQDGDRYIGNCSLNNVDLVNQTADIGIFIGDKEDRHIGYGGEALELLLDYGFQYVNLYNIMLKVVSFNEEAIKLYMKLGFEVFGIRKHCYYFNGEWYDIVYMQLLKEQFVSVKN